MEDRREPGLKVTCYYCGATKRLQLGTVVKLTCDQCVSPRVILDREAVFKCNNCGRTFTLPPGKQVMAFHDVDDCKGRSLILIDYT